MKKILMIFLAIFLFMGCGNNNKNRDNTDKQVAVSKVKKIDFSVVKTFPHDVTSFTEGFLYHEKQLWESTGSPENLDFTRSVFGTVDLTTGKIGVKGELDRNKYFGEGIVFIKDKMYQLTYKNQTAFVYDAKTFRKTAQFSYKNKEGWGLTTDGTYLIMSDGTDKLTYIDPVNYAVVKTLPITEDNTATEYVNELEFINGFIYANLWTTNYIVKIDTADGSIVGKMDLSPLFDEAKAINPDIDVMNGIAWDADENKIYITGKLWPNIFQIEFPH